MSTQDKGAYQPFLLNTFTKKKSMGFSYYASIAELARR